MVKRTYDAAVELFAYLCKEYGLNPLGDGVILSHKEGYARGIATNHGDPEHLWNGLETGYTMNGFRNDVYAAMNGTAGVAERSVNYVGTITADVLNIRKRPSPTAAVIGRHASGDVVTVNAETENGWYRVDYPDIGTGYIHSEYVSVAEPVEGEGKPTEATDNTPDAWAETAVNGAISMGILFGDGDGDLKLHRECTRQEVILFLYRFYKNLQ
jgi:hypothetical protein